MMEDLDSVQALYTSRNTQLLYDELGNLDLYYVLDLKKIPKDHGSLRVVVGLLQQSLLYC